MAKLLSAVDELAVAEHIRETEPALTELVDFARGCLAQGHQPPEVFIALLQAARELTEEDGPSGVECALQMLTLAILRLGQSTSERGS